MDILAWGAIATIATVPLIVIGWFVTTSKKANKARTSSGTAILPVHLAILEITSRPTTIFRCVTLLIEREETFGALAPEDRIIAKA